MLGLSLLCRTANGSSGHVRRGLLFESGLQVRTVLVPVLWPVLGWGLGYRVVWKSIFWMEGSVAEAL